MGLFDRLFPKKEKGQPEELTSDQVIETMLGLAEGLLNGGSEAEAVQMYRSILQLRPDTTAQYNLGSLHAQGRGVEQDFCEGGYYFRQAELAGDESAARMVLKCELDFVDQHAAQDDPAMLYTHMQHFVSRVFPEDAADERIGSELHRFGMHFLGKKEYAKAYKLFRAAGEFCNNDQAQEVLGWFYRDGLGMIKRRQVALYWFDRAMTNGNEAARGECMKIYDAMRSEDTPSAFAGSLRWLAGCCERGTADIPRTPEKVAYWQRIAQEAASIPQGNEETPLRESAEEYVWEAMQRLADEVRTKMAAGETCEQYQIRFPYPGTQYHTSLTIKRSNSKNERYRDSYYLACTVSTAHSNAEFTLELDTLEKHIAFLEDRGNVPRLVADYQQGFDILEEEYQ